jgi:uncharacterized membrane protein YhaH (DUF805 family)
MLRLLTSPRGRITRAQFWLGFAVVVGIFIAAAVAIVAWAGLTGRTFPDDPAAPPVWFVIVSVGGGIAFYCALSPIGVKRLHDHDKVGWWYAIYMLTPLALHAIEGLVRPDIAFGFHLVQYAIYVWTIVELGVLRGTVGPNRFGEDLVSGNA